MQSSPYIIETRDVWRVYKLGAQEVPALRGVNIQMSRASWLH
jgi:hypothetical protein